MGFGRDYLKAKRSGTSNFGPRWIGTFARIIELRLNAKHEGDDKTSLTGKVAIDGTANTIALESYAALPITLKDIKPGFIN